MDIWSVFWIYEKLLQNHNPMLHASMYVHLQWHRPSARLLEACEAENRIITRCENIPKRINQKSVNIIVSAYTFSMIHTRSTLIAVWFRFCKCFYASKYIWHECCLKTEKRSYHHMMHHAWVEKSWKSDEIRPLCAKWNCNLDIASVRSNRPFDLLLWK